MTRASEFERGQPGRIVAFIPLYRREARDGDWVREKRYYDDDEHSFYWERVDYDSPQQGIDATVARLWMGMLGNDK
jgi:hypothetical protein